MTGNYHRFNTDIASDVGVNAAVVYNDIAFWCKENDSKGKEARLYSSLDDFVKRMPYFTKDKVRLALKKLIDGGYITKGYTFGVCYYESNMSVWEKPHIGGENPTSVWEKSHPIYINENNIINKKNNNARAREKFIEELKESQIKKMYAMKTLGIHDETKFMELADSILCEWELKEDNEWSWDHFLKHARIKKQYESNSTGRKSADERLAEYRAYLFSSSTGE